MRTHKRAVALSLALLAVVVAAVVAAMNGQGQHSSAAGNQEESMQDQVPIAVYSTENVKAQKSNTGHTDAQEDRHRAAKNKKYDKSFTVEELPPNITVKPKSAHWTESVPALPIAQSNAVVVGEVVDAHAFLSEDKTGIYSEFTIAVDEVIKTDAPLNPGQSVITERAGGAVRFPSGKVQRIYVFRGQRLPLIGNRYLFFLKREETISDFSILTGYEFQQEKVASLDTIEPYTSYTGTDAKTFLDLVRNKVRLNLTKDSQTTDSQKQ